MFTVLRTPPQHPSGEGQSQGTGPYPCGFVSLTPTRHHSELNAKSTIRGITKCKHFSKPLTITKPNIFYNHTGPSHRVHVTRAAQWPGRTRPERQTFIDLISEIGQSKPFCQVEETHKAKIVSLHHSIYFSIHFKTLYSSRLSQVFSHLPEVTAKLLMLAVCLPAPVQHLELPLL